MSDEDFAPSGVTVAELISWTQNQPATLETSAGTIEGLATLEFNGPITLELFGSTACPDVLRVRDARWVITSDGGESVATTARGELLIGGSGFPERLALWKATEGPALEELEPQLADAHMLALSDACSFVQDGGCRFTLFSEENPEAAVAISTSW